MSLIHHPELLDRLAAAYALGTLRAGARRRFETLAREHPQVRTAALSWQGRFATMNELQPKTEPASAVWTRIENLVRADGEQRRMAGARLVPAAAGWWRNLALWRGAGLAGALATVLAVVNVTGLRQQMGETDHVVGQLNAQVSDLQVRLSAAPQISYVAVLNDDQASAAMLVTFDPKNGKLSLQRVGAYQEAADKSLQLWALPSAGGPRSLGVLTPEKLLQLTAGEAEVQAVPTLAISLEPRGGVPSAGGPTGPVLFKGTLIRKMT